MGANGARDDANFRLLSLDDDLGRRAYRTASAAQLVAHLGCDLPIDRRVRTVRVGRHHWAARIRGLADGDVERHLAEERHAEPLGLAARAAVAEDVRTRAALRALKIAHVLDHAEHRYIDAPEHGDAAARVDQREVLRRRDDDAAGER